jgi:hypothetical protein
MEQLAKEREENRQRERRAMAKLPEEHLTTIIFGGHRPRCSVCHVKQYAELFGHATGCSVHTSRPLEAGLTLLKFEYDAGKIIRLNDATHTRLIQFALPDETYPDLINRLLDIAVEAKLSTNSS